MHGSFRFHAINYSLKHFTLYAIYPITSENKTKDIFLSKILGMKPFHCHSCHAKIFLDCLKFIQENYLCIRYGRFIYKDRMWTKSWGHLSTSPICDISLLSLLNLDLLWFICMYNILISSQIMYSRNI
jgi:hypothetical protein